MSSLLHGILNFRKTPFMKFKMSIFNNTLEPNKPLIFSHVIIQSSYGSLNKSKPAN